MMFDYTNRVKHDPENGRYGDCFRVAVAYMLRLDPDTVPHFCEDGLIGAMDRADAWLLERGLALVALPYDQDSATLLDAIGRTARQNWPAVEYMICGRSRTGCNHNVVYRNGGVVCDPVPGAGIVGPSDDGYTWVEFLVPVAGALNELDRLRAENDRLRDDSPGTPLGRWKALEAWARLQPWCPSPYSSSGWEGALMKHVDRLRNQLADAQFDEDSVKHIAGEGGVNV